MGIRPRTKAAKKRRMRIKEERRLRKHLSRASELLAGGMCLERPFEWNHDVSAPCRTGISLIRLSLARGRQEFAAGFAKAEFRDRFRRGPWSSLRVRHFDRQVGLVWRRRKEKVRHCF